MREKFNKSRESVCSYTKGRNQIQNASETKEKDYQKGRE